ncbi:MAG TPA: DEAD/DEAH box helicase [Planctomycetota bacterium]|nr:DEAD/DEAH box helicase [Planctomycetota bacterium]
MTPPPSSSHRRSSRRPGRRAGPGRRPHGGRHGGHRDRGDADSAPPPPEPEAPDESLAIPLEECAFAEYGLKPDLLAAIAACGYRTPSEIQAKTLPYALEGRDVIGQAKTGTGKTAAFLVPLLQNLSDRPGPRVVVVVPTRELSVQVAREAQRLGRLLGVRATAIYGGDSMKRQLTELKQGLQVIAATPGRLLDHVGRHTISLRDLDGVVLDEADRMFDLGFRDDMAKILGAAQGRRQTMLFSATLSDEVLGLAKKYMSDPAQVFLAPDVLTVESVHQTCFPIDKERKLLLLLELLRREKPERSIIFTRTKIGADKLAEKLQKAGIGANEIHSGLPQKKRERILRGFRDGEFPYLVATDVAARGLDIEDVTHVINWDVPENAEDYVHRVGRTARMGKQGRAATFVTPEDGEFITAIEKLINKEVPIERFEDFVHNVAPEGATPGEPQKPKPPSYTRTMQGFVRTRRRR